MLTVIVPVYNKAPFLRRCLDSCLKQEKNVEFIVVDDGSTDGGGEICDEYIGDKRFRVFHKENGGVSSARNYGIEKARGERITFLDADDEYPLGAVYMLNKLSVGNVSSFNHKRQFGNRAPMLTKYLPQGKYSFYKRETCWWGVWNKTYRTEFIKGNGIRFDEKVNYGEDLVFNLECFVRDSNYQHFSVPTLIRHFDDKKSLVHTFGAEGVLEQFAGIARVKHRLEQSGENPKAVAMIEKLVSEYRDSVIYRNRLENMTPEEYVKCKNLTAYIF